MLSRPPAVAPLPCHTVPHRTASHHSPPMGPFHRMVLQSDSAFLISSLLSGPTSKPCGKGGSSSIGRQAGSASRDKAGTASI
jgi:hypothetical protein